jgi:uncharacterized membrane protein
LHTVHHVTGGVLWANLHLLFWLSLIPFVTNWMGKTCFAPLPVAVYGVVMLLSGCAYLLLTRVLIASQGRDSKLARAMGRDLKGTVSLLLYMVGILVAFGQPYVACAMYALVSMIWFIPDRRIERTLKESGASEPRTK